MTPDNHAIKELRLWTDNDGDLYRRMIRPYHVLLAKRIAAGTYNEIKALQGFKRIVNEAAKNYQKEFGPTVAFTPGVKESVARQLECFYRLDFDPANF